MTLKENIMKLQTYKMFEGEDTLYVERDDVLKLLEQEQSGDLIQRQAVLDALYELCNTGETLIENPWRDNPHIDALIDAIEELPSVNPQEKTGHWIIYDVHGHKACKCSECDKDVGYPCNDKYCPNCGCLMINPQERSDKE